MYQASNKRYEQIDYRKVGKWGIKLPAISLGLWHNFGGVDIYENFRKVLHTAFDLGISHFDLANNYGPPPGSAEENFGDIFKKDFKPYRDELIISSKAGYLMWPGPYGEWGSRKYLVASCDQSLKRMGLDYVDIFYSHRFDPNTPLEETMGALDFIVRSGRALYAGISSYSPEQTQEAAAILKELGTPCLIHQPKYSMFHREPEEGLMDTLEENGIGCIPFSPLAQGLLSDKYLKGVPSDSRVAKGVGFLTESHLDSKTLEKIKALNELAQKREQSLAQMAVSWLLKDPRVSSVLIGASKPAQVLELVEASKNYTFSNDELRAIDNILS
jgi:L-glyceraldehyde 3-phosphate reductase